MEWVYPQYIRDSYAEIGLYSDIVGQQKSYTGSYPFTK
jgi:hypothetical protein